jgi:uncharacterized protein (DUF924 family)
MNLDDLDAIHDYWFGEPLEEPAGEERMARWFRPAAAVDDHIRVTFGPLIPKASATEWDLSRLSQRQQTALVILLDQFPRQIHRGSGEAFASDAKARAIARLLVAEGQWRRFPSVARAFLFLPFEHSEDVADQDLSLLLFCEAIQAAPPASLADARLHLDFATKHRDIIRRFGRFPHRNVDLGRTSTPEEIEFLKGGRGF